MDQLWQSSPSGDDLDSVSCKGDQFRRVATKWGYKAERYKVWLPGCTPSMRHECVCDVRYLANAEVFRFSMRLREPSGVASARWALKASIQHNDDDSFVDIGNEVLGTPWPERVEAGTRNADLTHGSSFYLHIYLCDNVGNCGMVWGPRTFVDLSPPRKPPRFIADRRRPWTEGPPNTIGPLEGHVSRSSEGPHYWNHNLEHQISWNTLWDNQTTRQDVFDSESGLVTMEYRLWHLDQLASDEPGAPRIRKLVFPYRVSAGRGRYSYADFPEFLAHGHRYMVEVKLTNLALLSTSMLSYPITVDVVPPEVPKMASAIELRPFGTPPQALAAVAPRPFATPESNPSTGPGNISLESSLPPHLPPPAPSPIPPPPAPGQFLVQVDESLPTATEKRDIRRHVWISPNLVALEAELSGGEGTDSPPVCTDGEAQIELEVSVGSTESTSDLLAPFIAAAGTPSSKVSSGLLSGIGFEIAGGGFTLRPAVWSEATSETEHHINVWCRSKADMSTRCLSKSVRVDTTPPVCAFSPVLGDGRVAWASSITTRLVTRGKWGFSRAISDTLTGIRRVAFHVEYQEHPAGNLANVRKPDAPLASAWLRIDQLPSIADPSPLAWMSREGVTARLPLLHAHWYRLVATSTNGVGDLSTCASTGVLVDTQAPNMSNAFVSIVHRNRDALLVRPRSVAYQASTNVMRLVMRGATAVSGINEWHVTIYQRQRVNPVKDIVILQETSVGAREVVPVPVDLVHRAYYLARVRAESHAQLSNEVWTSVVMVDATPPIVGIVYDMEPFDDDVNLVGVAELEVSALFTIYDPESGIASATWCIGVFPGGCDFVAPQPIPSSSLGGRMASGNASVTNLLDGVRYYSSVVAHNGAGGYATVTSDGFLVDLVPPECGQVFDGAVHDYAFVGPTMVGIPTQGVDGGSYRPMTGMLQMSWANFVDRGAGIAGYAAAIVNTSDPTSNQFDDAPFEEVGLGESVKAYVLFEHSVTYYAAISTWDRLGHTRICLSNGVQFDATPPDLSGVVLTNRLGIARNVQRATHMIYVSLTGAVDPESGISQVFAAVGTAEDGVESLAAFRFVGMTGASGLIVGGLALPDGDILVTARVRNGAKEDSERSLVVSVDSAPPRCSAVTIGDNAPGQSFQYTNTLTHLEASWSCSDVAPWEHVELACSWAVGTFPGAADAMRWAAARQNGTHVFSDAGLRNGVSYFVTVRCRDQVLLTAEKTSGVLMPDLHPPTVCSPAAVMHANGALAHFVGNVRFSPIPDSCILCSWPCITDLASCALTWSLEPMSRRSSLSLPHGVSTIPRAALVACTPRFRFHPSRLHPSKLWSSSCRCLIKARPVHRCHLPLAASRCFTGTSTTYMSARRTVTTRPRVVRLISL